MMILARYPLLGVIALLLCGCSNESSIDRDPLVAGSSAVVIKIGQASPLTGNVAHLGKDAESGVRLAIEELNQQNIHIGGKKAKFELVSEDDQGDPKTATMVAARLVDAHVAAVIGHMNSGTSIPASKIYADAGIPQISPSTTSPVYTQQGYKTTFRIIASDIAQGKALGDYVVNKMRAERVAIIDDRTAYGQGLADEFEKEVKAGGAKIVGREFTNNRATDFMAILTVLKAKQPQVIFYGGMDAQAGPMAAQIKKLGIPAKLFGGDGLQTPEFIRLAGEAAEGHYASLSGKPHEQMPGWADFSKKFQQKFAKEVQIHAPNAYDATKIAALAMQKAGSADPAKYLPALVATEYDGIAGKIRFDDKGDLKSGTVTVYRVNQGKWEAVSVISNDSSVVEPQAEAKHQAN